MYTAFLIGNIASGKSTAAKYLESHGAYRLDLDQMAKDLYLPGSPVLKALSAHFGDDILDHDGSLIRPVLARKAFSTPEGASQLNAIVHPILLKQLALSLQKAALRTDKAAPTLTVVEVSVPQDFTSAFDLADEIVAITAPLDVRRSRAVARGMSPDDFDRRALRQVSEDTLVSYANTVYDNSVADDGLFAWLDRWMSDRGLLPAVPDGFEADRL